MSCHHARVRHAVILAGGTGTRLWPASRRARPKQLLPIGPGGETLLAAAIRRARAVVQGDDRIVVVTAASQAAATRDVIPGIELIAEPIARNTAAAIGLAAATLVRRDREATLVVLPADHHISDEAGLTRVLERGLAAVEEDDAIGTVGITPSRAETGFGYLEVDAATPGEIVPVLRFVEKPDRATAEQYVASKRYLWNAGMFFASAKRLIAELENHIPPIGRAVQEIVAGTARAEDLYPQLPAISIDHGVMERVSRVFTIPASVGWDDIGSWAALPALLGRDAADNTIAGSALVIDGRGNIILGDDMTVATLGVSELVIVKSGNAMLVMAKSEAQRVREVVEALDSAGLDDLL